MFGEGAVSSKANGSRRPGTARRLPRVQAEAWREGTSGARGAGRGVARRYGGRATRRVTGPAVVRSYRDRGGPPRTGTQHLDTADSSTARHTRQAAPHRAAGATWRRGRTLLARNVGVGALGEHHQPHGLAGAVRQHHGAADEVVGAARVQREADVHLFRGAAEKPWVLVMRHWVRSRFGERGVGRAAVWGVRALARTGSHELASDSGNA
jgi:hypothetical protein